VWDVASAKTLYTVQTGETVPFGGYALLAFTPDGKQLLSCDRLYGNPHIWDTASAKLLQRLPIQERRQSVLFFRVAPDNASVIVFGQDPKAVLPQVTGIITTWDMKAGVRKSTADINLSGSFQIAVSPDGSALTQGPTIIDVATRSARVRLSGVAQAFSSDG